MDGARRVGRGEHAIALAGDLADPRAHGDHQIRRLHPRDQLGVGREAEIAAIARVARVEQRRAAVAGHDRNVEPLGEAMDRCARGLVPARAADQQHRPLGRQQHLAQARHLARAGRGFRRRRRRAVSDLGLLGQHVLRQSHNHRPRPAGGSGLEGAVDVFRRALGVVEFGGPFSHGAEHLGVVHLLEGLAATHGLIDLTHEQDHRRGILLRHVHAGRGVGRARSAGDKTDAGLAGRLAVGLGHHGRPALLAANDHLDRNIVQRVEHIEIAFARDAEDVGDAVRDQPVDQNLGGGAGLQARKGTVRAHAPNTTASVKARSLRRGAVGPR